MGTYVDISVTRAMLGAATSNWRSKTLVTTLFDTPRMSPADVGTRPERVNLDCALSVLHDADMRFQAASRVIGLKVPEASVTTNTS